MLFLLLYVVRASLPLVVPLLSLAGIPLLHAIYPQWADSFAASLTWMWVLTGLISWRIPFLVPALFAFVCFYKNNKLSSSSQSSPLLDIASLLLVAYLTSGSSSLSHLAFNGFGILQVLSDLCFSFVQGLSSLSQASRFANLFPLFVVLQDCQRLSLWSPSASGLLGNLQTMKTTGPWCSGSSPLPWEPASSSSSDPGT